MVKIKNMTEIGKGHLAHVQALRQACRVTQNKIILDVLETTTYEIPLSRCDTYQKVVGWVLQLSGKNWVTTELLAEFVKTACRAHGLNPFSTGAQQER